MTELDLQPFPQDDRSRAGRVFSGSLVVYRQVPSMQVLLHLAGGYLRDAFGQIDPVTAHDVLAPADYLKRVCAMQKGWRRDSRVRDAWIKTLGDTGANLDQTFYDWFYLRVLPPSARHIGRATPQLPAHRDTWGSNVYQQINWWAPILPVTAESTLVVHLDYWERPIANTSENWDLAELRRLPLEKRRDYPELPDLLEPLAGGRSLPVVIEPGDLLCFSAQHLHAGRPNTTPYARFSMECRTVNLDDVCAGRAAPNMDGAAPRVAWDWFKRITDGKRLSDQLPEVSLSTPPRPSRRSDTARVRPKTA